MFLINMSCSSKTDQMYDFILVGVIDYAHQEHIKGLTKVYS
jgi:hypothetical protein